MNTIGCVEMSSQASKLAPFLPQHKTFDPEDERLFKIQIEKAWIDTALRVNERVIGGFYKKEQLTGKEYFGANNQRRRQSFRKLTELTGLATGANAIAHGITFPSPNIFRIVCYEGGIWSLAATTYAPLPNGDITMTVDATNINITIPAAYNGYDGYITLEYIKF
jgi:hypothetical protein